MATHVQHLTSAAGNGYGNRESFFAFCTARGGYSGTATFCRTAATLPVAAEAGLAGTAPPPADGSPGAQAGWDALHERWGLC